MQKNFLQDNTLDFGAGAYPLFYDYNSDGLLDIICGNFGYFNSGDNVGQLAVLKNTGNLNQATFTLVDDAKIQSETIGNQVVIPYRKHVLW